MNNIFVTRSSMPPLEEYIKEIEDIWESHWLTNMGKHHQQLEQTIKERFAIEKLDLFVNGHMSLELAIQALELEGEVITTPFTFASTIHAIVRNGLKPVLCDIDEKDFTIDVTKMEQLITEKTCAIIPVHVYGNVCDVETISELANKYGLKVLYDAAHAFGVTYRGKSVFSYGDASICSFHATKVFNTIEGGMVCYRDEEFGQRLRKLRNFGIASEEIVDVIGANAKMNEMQAAMGICNLRHFDEEMAKRKSVAGWYRERLQGKKGIILQQSRKGQTTPYSYFPVLFTDDFRKERDEVCEQLALHNIYARKYFYPLVNHYECYREILKADIPVAEKISKQVVCLPLYADLSKEDVWQICDIILDEGE